MWVAEKNTAISKANLTNINFTDVTMEAKTSEIHLSRSKSAGFLDKLSKDFKYKCFNGRFCGYSGCDNRHASVSSMDACFESNGSDLSTEDHKLDSGIDKSLLDGETLFVLERKVDKLSELLKEQHEVLKCIKEEVYNSKNLDGCQFSNVSKESDVEMDFIRTNGTTRIDEVCDDTDGRPDKQAGDSSAQSLLSAIEIKKDISLDQMINMALENFLQSESLKAHVAGATAECVKGVVLSSLNRVISAAYLPMVERSHRRLIKHVTKLLEESFVELEEGSTSIFRSIHKTSRNIRTSLERHQKLLEATDPERNIKVLRSTLKEVLEEELKVWRARLMDELYQETQIENCNENEYCPDSPYVDYTLISPSQPANPDISIIDSLMKCALINKHMHEGDVNRAFEEALSSSDLSLVMAACRAAPVRPPAAARLRPAVLLSLLQQLATDMVHDTQLKCRYLEEAILCLDKCDSATRAHLPLVVSDVRKHLTKFLLAYPKHHASRRVALIVMAADNLLK